MMTLTKPFDLVALVAALKDKGLVDAEKVVENDGIKVLFDWLNSSVQMEVASIPLLSMALPVLQVLENKVIDELDKLTAPKA